MGLVGLAAKVGVEWVSLQGAKSLNSSNNQTLGWNRTKLN